MPLNVAMLIQLYCEDITLPVLANGITIIRHCPTHHNPTTVRCGCNALPTVIVLSTSHHMPLHARR